MSVKNIDRMDSALKSRIVEMYLSKEKPSAEDVASRVNETAQTVRYILSRTLPADVWAAEKAIRYSRGKLGQLNPMKGKCLEKHHLWKGVVSDDKGHLTIKTSDGSRQFVHRLVMAESLGLPVSAIRKFDVHHIDGNGENNEPDNLALVTKSGHRKLHRIWSELKDSPLWERYKSLILP